MNTVSTKQCAVVTGAASGIGRALVLACADRGWDVVLADIDQKGLEAVAREVCGKGVRCVVCRTDVAEHRDVAALADRAYEAFGGVDLLFNIAGVLAPGPVWSSSLEDWNWSIGVNLMGVVNGVRSFVPRMLSVGKPGHIVNMASMWGLASGAGVGTYCATKHAVVALSECLSKDLIAVDSQIIVSVVCPASVATRIGTGERPPQFQAENTSGEQDSARVLSKIAASDVSAEQAALSILEGVGRGAFYIFTHPGSDAPVRGRMTAILAGMPASELVGG